MNSFLLALCQMKVCEKKEDNIKNALQYIDMAKEKGANIVVLPEMFCSPYDNTKFIEYSEPSVGSRMLECFSESASKNEVYIIAGSYPELDGDKLYNTSVVFNKNGKIIGKHRKMHLFDIDIKGKIKFTESDVLSPGNQVVIVDTEYCKIGVMICYDMRFPELARIMALRGANLIIVPAAFNMTTGPAHWDILIRTRALDNQLYMGVCSPARDESSNYVAYGSSMIVNPWGTILTKASCYEDFIISEINLDYLKKIRDELPLLKHRREDIYKLELL